MTSIRCHSFRNHNDFRTFAENRPGQDRLCGLKRLPRKRTYYRFVEQRVRWRALRKNGGMAGLTRTTGTECRREFGPGKVEFSNRNFVSNVRRHGECEYLGAGKNLDRTRTVWGVGPKPDGVIDLKNVTFEGSRIFFDNRFRYQSPVGFLRFMFFFWRN